MIRNLVVQLNLVVQFMEHELNKVVHLKVVISSRISCKRSVAQPCSPEMC